MTSRHTGGPQPAKDKPATIAVVVAVAAVLIGFLAPGLAIFLALVAVVMAVVLLVRSGRGPNRRGAAIATFVAAFVALVVAGANMPTPAPAPVADPVVVDPNALPASVLVASAQSPDNLVTNVGRRLHVTMMQGYSVPDACRTGSDRATANQLVAGKQVTIAAPDPARVDEASAVPAGFQPVVLTLPDGRDYAQAWVAAAPRTALTSCTTPTTTTTTPAPTTTEEPEPTTTVEEQPEADVDRPFVPAPRTKARSGQSGHPCLPGERDGDGDGYCGE